MKTLKLIAVGITLLVSSSIEAQISVNVNIGSPPAWGPAGYSSVEYYYLPDVQAYYDVRATQFIYFGGGRWIRSRYLPNQYRNYDLYNGYKVVLNDYHGSRPYSHYKEHKVKYYRGYKGRPQRNIGNHNNHYKNYNNNRNYGNDNRNKGNNGNHGHKEEREHGRGHGKH
ncbi:hypothetical protein [Flavobacterium lacustre]|uniref:hypothetical protein n=1 Tax=Flavobacterium lacustre TaxID=3016339 RepID=UPI0022B74026|nr:hypothetical protein [Flavobacterium lacustre]